MFLPPTSVELTGFSDTSGEGNSDGKAIQKVEIGDLFTVTGFVTHAGLSPNALPPDFSYQLENNVRATPQSFLGSIDITTNLGSAGYYYRPGLGALTSDGRQPIRGGRFRAENPPQYFGPLKVFVTSFSVGNLGLGEAPRQTAEIEVVPAFSELVKGIEIRGGVTQKYFFEFSGDICNVNARPSASAPVSEQFSRQLVEVDFSNCLSDGRPEIDFVLPPTRYIGVNKTLVLQLRRRNESGQMVPIVSEALRFSLILNNQPQQGSVGAVTDQNGYVKIPVKASSTPELSLTDVRLLVMVDVAYEARSVPLSQVVSFLMCLFMLPIAARKIKTR